MKKTDFNEKTQALITKVEQKFPKEVIIEQDNDRQEDWLAFDQSGHKIDSAGNLRIVVAHSSDLNFTVAHELRHVLLEMSDLPKISFPVTTGQPEMDSQVKVTGAALIGSAEHILIMQQQYAHQEVNAAVTKQFKVGIAKKVPAETDKSDNMYLFRILMLLDALTFSQGEVYPDWQQAYPKAMPTVKKLYDNLVPKIGMTAFSVRRSEIELLSDFNEILATNHFQTMPYADFMAIGPVVSQRQLRLAMKQVFQIKHSNFNSLKTKHRAFLLIGASDNQSVAELNLQANLQPAAYQDLYQTTVKDFLEQQKIAYSVR